MIIATFYRWKSQYFFIFMTISIYKKVPWLSREIKKVPGVSLTPWPFFFRFSLTLQVSGNPDSAVLPNFHHCSKQSPLIRIPPLSKKNIPLRIFIYRKNDSAKHVSIAPTFQTIHSPPHSPDASQIIQESNICPFNRFWV